MEKDQAFDKFKKKWSKAHKKDTDACCRKGWDHVHIVMQTLVVTGGFLIMTLYKGVWAKYGRTIHHWEEGSIVLLGTFFMIYLVYLIFNRRIVTVKIW